MNNRGYAVLQADGILTITLSKDAGDLLQSTEWSRAIADSVVARFHTLMVDISRMPVLSSTTIAGLLHLQDTYRQRGTNRVVILGVTDRTRRTLEMMNIISLFECQSFDPRNP